MNRHKTRIVITGTGLTSSLGNNIEAFREGLLNNKSGISKKSFHDKYTFPVGLCDFDAILYQDKKMSRKGSRSGSISCFSVGSAIKNAKLKESDLGNRTGVYIGITDHGANYTAKAISMMPS